MKQCSKCEVHISDNVSEFSVRNYGEELCIPCQRKKDSEKKWKRSDETYKKWEEENRKDDPDFYLTADDMMMIDEIMAKQGLCDKDLS